MDKNKKLTYLITVSRKHLIPCSFLLRTLINKTNKKIILVGNLENKDRKNLLSFGENISYIDENDINLSDRFPNVKWKVKFREVGWYKQMFIRLSIDRFIDSDYVVILDSEVFVFDNWNENLFFQKNGNPRCFYWIPKIRKPAWDYRMYKGAAFLFQYLPEFKNVMKYANSNRFKRHISGVVLFSTKNIKYLWDQLEFKTDLQKNIDVLFNQTLDLAFCDHDFYGIAIDYGFFNKVVPTKLHNNLLGWYDNHDDPNFHKFKQNAMWSMCQKYFEFPTISSYQNYMEKIALELDRKLPRI